MTAIGCEWEIIASSTPLMRSGTSSICWASAIERKSIVTTAFPVLKVSVRVHPTRLACTGNPNGPSLYHLLEVMGKEKVMGRIEQTLSSAFA